MARDAPGLRRGVDLSGPCRGGRKERRAGRPYRHGSPPCPVGKGLPGNRGHHTDRMGSRPWMGARLASDVPVSAEPLVSRPAAAPAPVVEFRNVTVRFGSFIAVSELSLNVEDVPGKGEFVAIIGPSGCGKSTVLNLIAGFLQPAEGEVLVNGQPVKGPGSDRGMIFQQYSSFPHLTVLGNVLFGLEINKRELGMGPAARLDRARQLIKE